CPHCQREILAADPTYRCTCGTMYHLSCAASLTQCPNCRTPITVDADRTTTDVSMRCESCGELQTVPQGTDPRVAPCSNCSEFLRHLDEGKRYLVVAGNPSIGFAWLRDLTKLGRPAICMTSAAAERMRLEFGVKDVPVVQVSSHGADAIDPKELDPVGLRSILQVTRERKSEVVQDSCDDEVDQVRDSLRLPVKSRGRGHDDDAEARELEHVLQRDGADGGLARDEDQFPIFLDRHRGGSRDEIVRDAGRNLCEGRPTARHHDDGTEQRRARCRCRSQIVLAIARPCPCGELLHRETGFNLDDRLGVPRRDDICAVPENFDEAPGILHTRGTRDGDEDPGIGGHARERRGVQMKSRRGTRRQRLPLAHARPAEAELERDDRGVSSLDVHGAGPSRPRPRSSHRSGSDSIRKGARHPRDAPPRFGLWRADLHASRFRANDGDAPVLGTRKTSPWTRSHLPENGATREMTIPSVRARKPSNTTSIYEARTRRVFPMTTAYDVPPVLLIERIKEKLQTEGKIKPPEWAAFARTRVNTEKAPTQKDWWYRRVAAVLRKVYLHGPVGTSRLAAEFGGRRDDGAAPYHPRRGSRSVAREAMQQLQAMDLLTKTDKKG